MNSYRFSKLIFITAAVFIENKAKKDIYIYHIPKNGSLKGIIKVLKVDHKMKLYFFQEYYDFIRISFEEKFNEDENHAYSGLIKFIPNSEFYVQLGDRENQGFNYLVKIKVIKKFGFLFATISMNEETDQCPYCIVNNLNKEVTYQQKEIPDDEMKEYFKQSGNKSRITARTLEPKDKNLVSQFFAWDEPFMHDQKGKNLLVVIFFGVKYEIDMDNIHDKMTFLDRKSISQKEFIIFNVVKEGKIHMKDKFSLSPSEYTYSLYEWGLILFEESSNEEKEKTEKIRFEFHDKELNLFRHRNGHIMLSDYEMFCLSEGETDFLAGKIFKYIEKANELTENVIIIKYVKNKSIYVEIAMKNNIRDVKNEEEEKFVMLCDVKNVCISLMHRNQEFLYLWCDDIGLGINQQGSCYKNISLKMRDFQVDHYLKNGYYPIVLSPMIDKNQFEQDLPYYKLEIVDFKYSDFFFQIESINMLLNSLDCRVEFDLVKKFIAFNKDISKIFSRRDENENTWSMEEFLDQIDRGNFFNPTNKKENLHVQVSKEILLIKTIVCSEIKCCISLKMDNIETFLQNSRFLKILKPLFTELGMKILNMDCINFNMIPFFKQNIVSSKEDTMLELWDFYYPQLISEIVKSLGGISTQGSIQFLEDLNSKVLHNLKMKNYNIPEESTNEIELSDIANSSYKNIILFVSGIFTICFKIMYIFGKFLTELTIDETFKQQRNLKINDRIQGFWFGIFNALSMLIFALFYTIRQFYLIPLKQHGLVERSTSGKIFILYYVYLILFIGLILKPIIGVSDMITKTFEAIAISIKEIFNKRVCNFSRFQRYIKDGELTAFDRESSLAYNINLNVQKLTKTSGFEDHLLIIPGEFEKSDVVILFTKDRLLIIAMEDVYTMVILLQVHYSECNFDFSGKKPDKEEKSQSFSRKIYLIEESNERFLFIKSVNKRRLFFDSSSREEDMMIKLLYCEKGGELDDKFQKKIINGQFLKREEEVEDD